ncbi:nitroreductase family protein [Kingella negevensis]|uniref:nitroreductase family protein n=1 Tax=Kingella negevensis TaxID=1522312 RepID=UPI00254DF8CB|nr:nitroreductase family protein [Kingella negevensis]MDK4688877.1 nitroreductase family protein [Kingella negevensis]
MDILELLTTRRSCKTLSAPAPDELQLDTIFQAATQVPDHGDLKPWRFVAIQSEEGMQRFQAALRETAITLNMGEKTLQKAERIGKFAPLVIGVIASPKEGKPEWEQHMSAACAAYAIQLAAKAQGFDNVWITGLWINAPVLQREFECTEKEKIIGLIMIGTAENASDEPKNWDVSEFVTNW